MLYIINSVYVLYAKGKIVKNKLLFGMVILMASSSVYASVKDKKAMRIVDNNIIAEVNKVKSSCGNSALDVIVDWDSYKSMISSNDANLKKDKYKSEWVISHSGQRTVAALEAIATICASDEDYKEELAKLKNIKITAKQDFLDSKNNFALSGNTLNIETGHKMTRSASDYMDKIKSLF